MSGGCFVSQRYEIDPGELICDLDCDLEALPAWGRLCVSEKGVRMMATCLGLRIPDEDTVAENDRLARLIAEVQAENLRMRRAFTQVVHAAKLAGITPYLDDLSEVAS